MKKETKEVPEIPETIDETLNTIKASGLSIKPIDPSSLEAKEHCAYQSCNDFVVFSVEDLPVCQKHAISLMHCFIPNKSNAE